MKKCFLLISALSICINVLAQTSPFVDEYLVGLTYYDLQTNDATSNRIVKNTDGSVAVAWTFAPSYDLPQAFPNRGTGYNYSTDDGVTWLYPFVPGTSQGPTTRTESIRTGFTNIVNTSSGSEMSVAHTSTSTALSYRSTKGSGAWTTSYPWGTNNNDNWPKAVAGGNDMVYAIFNGSGTSGTSTFGQTGPLFFSRSTDAGVSWSLKDTIPGTGADEYLGYGSDEYAIDAKGNTVAIVLGSKTSDLMLLKSTDAGITWTKKFVYKSPLSSLFDTNGTLPSDTNADGIADVIKGHSGDATVVIDENDSCHVFFSDFEWICYGSGGFNPNHDMDGLEYWNERMPQNGYIKIASAQDLNGNGTLDLPVPDSTLLCRSHGTYGAVGITQMPSAAVAPNGIIYLTYQTINELADTTQYHQAHTHIYIISSSDKGVTWSYPYNIVPMIADGGNGEFQEAVFATMAKTVDNYVYVLYQRDSAPGTSLYFVGTCEKDNNSGFASDIVFTRLDAALVNANTINSNGLFVSQSYPNPTTDFAYINISTKTAADLAIRVTDMLGKVIYSEVKTNVAAGGTTLTLNTSSWNSGLYTYTIISGSQKASRQMIVQ